MKFPTPMKWENLSFIISKTFPELEKQTIILYCVSESGTRCLEKKITFANYSTKLSTTLILSIVQNQRVFYTPEMGKTFMHTIFPFQNLCRRPLSNKLFIRRISVSRVSLAPSQQPHVVSCFLSKIPEHFRYPNASGSIQCS